MNQKLAFFIVFLVAGFFSLLIYNQGKAYYADLTAAETSRGEVYWQLRDWAVMQRPVSANILPR